MTATFSIFSTFGMRIRPGHYLASHETAKFVGGLSLIAAEDLLDWLEAHGQQGSLSCTEGGFAVWYR